jgi:ubiquinone/menaquinone biosynthesis C-methylase UbiE
MTSHQEQNAVVRDQFGKQAERYAGLMRDKPNPLLEKLKDAVKPTAQDKVLDVGCGPGRLSLSLAEITGHVTGIDLTPEMLAQAKALQSERGIANIDWMQGDILPMPFADESFTLVVTQATFHHLADPGAVLTEMTRVCVSGGRIVVIDLTPDAAKTEAFDRIETFRDPSHRHAMTFEELRALGHNAGLEELTIHRYGTDMPIEPVLASSSFERPGILEEIRALIREDAQSRSDRYGLQLRQQDGAIFATYPMTMIAWRRSSSSVSV